MVLLNGLIGILGGAFQTATSSEDLGRPSQGEVSKALMQIKHMSSILHSENVALRSDVNKLRDRLEAVLQLTGERARSGTH